MGRRTREQIAIEGMRNLGRAGFCISTYRVREPQVHNRRTRFRLPFTSHSKYLAGRPDLDWVNYSCFLVIVVQPGVAAMPSL